MAEISDADRRRCSAKSTTRTSPAEVKAQAAELCSLHPLSAWRKGGTEEEPGVSTVDGSRRRPGSNVPGYLTVAGIAAVVTFLLTFVMRWAAPRIGAIAMPGPRSVHTKPTPSLGGAAMFAGFLVAMAVASQLGQFHEIFADDTETVGLLLAAGVMFVVGAIDDLRDVSPPAKIAGQVLSGSMLSLLGVTMLYFRVPFASTSTWCSRPTSRRSSPSSPSSSWRTRST